MRCICTTRAGWVAFVALAIAGCGGTPTGEVSGTVTLDGRPIERGHVDFFPADGNGPTKGGEIVNGKYSVKDVPVGKAKVVITGTKVTGEVKLYATADSPTRKQVEELLPAKYSHLQQSGLRYDVTAGSNEKNFDLPK